MFDANKLAAQLKKRVDFSKFHQNNWIKEEAENNPTLKAIDENGGALWITPAGEIYFRRCPSEKPSKLANDKAKIVLSNFLDKSSILLFKGSGTGENAVEPDIASNEVYMVIDKFTPFASSEFYKKDGVILRTPFKPTEYLKMRAGEYIETPNTKKLLLHLCGGNEEHYQWVINWLAGFFQTLKTSDTALVLRGTQGTGKGLLMEFIISPLFGEEFIRTVGDDALDGKFKEWVEGKLFFNLNEIAHDAKQRKAVINFIKVLVTDGSMQTEAKFETAEVTEIFGNLLITSNEVSPLPIETGDRRFTVFQTGGNIKKLRWDTDALVRGIKSELKDFAVMLKSYKVDWVLYDTALDTPAKRSIVMNTNDRYSLFLTALQEKNLDYFNMQTEDISILSDLETIFGKGYISAKEITHLFNETHNDSDDTVTSRIVMKRLRSIDTNAFAMMGKKPTNGKIIMGEMYFNF